MTAVDGSPPVMVCHSADIRDRDGASDVTCRMLGTAPTVARLWADGGCAGPGLKGELERMGIGPEPGIVLKPKDSRGGQVLFRRWVVERTFSSTVSVSSLVEGLREEPGEFPGLVTLGGMSFPDASNGP